MPAGDVRNQYRASSSLTVTGLASLASSASLVAGWTSGIISNTTDLDLDDVIAAQFTLGAGTLTVGGMVQLYLYTRLADGTWPDLFSSGTEGTEGAATVHSAQVRDMGMYWIGGGPIEAGTPTNRVYTVPQTSLLSRLGFTPHEYALWVTQSTGQAFAASGHAIHVKGISAGVAQ